MPNKLEFITYEWLQQQLLNKTIIEIMKEFNIGKTTINRYIKKYKLQHCNNIERLKYRKYYLNENYFENIDNEKKAYWLGFLFADGCVYSHNNTVSIDLNKKDEGHLIKFLQDINSEHHLYYNNKINAVLCRISSSKLKKDLINLGCDSNKSLIIQLPKIDDSLYRHFIRGYFDGDGCISKSSSNQWKIDINSGSQIFLKQLNNIIVKQTSIDKKIKIANNNCFRLNYTHKKTIAIISDYLYHKASIYLDRKFEKYQQFLEDYCACTL